VPRPAATINAAMVTMGAPPEMLKAPAI